MRALYIQGYPGTGDKVELRGIGGVGICWVSQLRVE